MLRATLATLLLVAASLAAGQQSLEVISLRYRTADQVLDVLRPLVEPGGTLTGQGSQLIVRVSPDNLAEIRRALDAIDRPRRRLQISVRFDDTMQSSRRDLEVSGSVSNQGARIEGSARDSQRSRDERVDQRVQTMDGGRAMILGPGEGFAVIPRLSGNTVSMEMISSVGASTAHGRLGEWFELGAIERSKDRERRGIGSLSESSASGSRRVSVKVDALD